MQLLFVFRQILLLHYPHSKATTPVPVHGHVIIKGIYWNAAQTDWTGPFAHHIDHINIGSPYALFEGHSATSIAARATMLLLYIS